MKKDKHPLELADWPWWGIINYRGVYVEKLPSGNFKCLGRVATTGEEVDKIIRDRAEILGETIRKGQEALNKPRS